MTYPYNDGYEPPFPAAPVVMVNSDDGLSTGPARALLDTGSDGTLVPLTYLREIGATPPTETRIRSHWGEWRRVQLFVVDLKWDDLTFAGIFVVGDDQGSEIILGRDVLNRLRLLLGGRAHMTSLR